MVEGSRMLRVSTTEAGRAADLGRGCLGPGMAGPLTWVSLEPPGRRQCRRGWGIGWTRGVECAGGLSPPPTWARPWPRTRPALPQTRLVGRTGRKEGCVSRGQHLFFYVWLKHKNLKNQQKMNFTNSLASACLQSRNASSPASWKSQADRVSRTRWGGGRLGSTTVVEDGASIRRGCAYFFPHLM